MRNNNTKRNLSMDCLKFASRILSIRIWFMKLNILWVLYTSLHNCADIFECMPNVWSHDYQLNTRRILVVNKSRLSKKRHFIFNEKIEKKKNRKESNVNENRFHIRNTFEDWSFSVIARKAIKWRKNRPSKKTRRVRAKEM